MQFKSRPYVPPKGGDAVPIVVTRIVTIKNDTRAANKPKRGKLHYLAGPAKGKATKSAAQNTRVIEKKFFSIGRYIGNGKNLTAFVMIDPDDTQA